MKVLNDENTLWCKEKDGVVGIEECRQKQVSGACLTCKDGKKGREEFAEKQLLDLGGGKKTPIDQVPLGGPGAKKEPKEDAVDERRRCTTCTDGLIPLKWTTAQCMKCKKGQNRRAPELPRPKVKVKDPETIMRHAQHDKAMDELMGPDSVIRVENIGDIRYYGPSVVLKTFDIESLSDDGVEKFLIALADAGIRYRLRVQVTVEPELT